MQTIRCLSRWLPAVLFCIMVPMQGIAEQVAHHGVSVEANGTVKDCLSCHDGASGEMIATCTTKCRSTEEHSVLKPYPPLKKTDEYAPTGAVRASGLKIVRGMVTCITCHNLRKKNEYHLAILDQGKLCKTCHIRM